MLFKDELKIPFVTKPYQLFSSQTLQLDLENLL
jgi:hypothetical protein